MTRVDASVYKKNLGTTPHSFDSLSESMLVIIVPGTPNSQNSGTRVAVATWLHTRIT